MTSETVSPEKRYVALHRAIEQGNDDDAAWSELSRVCLRLGYVTEAMKGLRNIKDPDKRHRAEMFLARRGVIDNPAARSVREVEAERPKLIEEVVDSFSYLFIEHMPFTVMAATLVFPLVLGVGGTFAAGAGSWVFPAIAALPVLFVIGLVGALARQIFLETSRGIVEPPRIPEFAVLTRAAGRFLQDSLLVLLALVVPGVLAMQLGLTAFYAVPIILLGGSLVPMALALSQVRTDTRALTPKVLLPAVQRCGMSYYAIVVVAGALFTPAILALVLTGTSDLYLRLSFIGPLAIAPLFVVSRLMGRLFYLHRDQLAEFRQCADEAVNQPEAVAGVPITSRVHTASGLHRALAANVQGPAAGHATGGRHPAVQRRPAPARPPSAVQRRPERVRERWPQEHTHPETTQHEQERRRPAAPPPRPQPQRPQQQRAQQPAPRPQQQPQRPQPQRPQQQPRPQPQRTQPQRPQPQAQRPQQQPQRPPQKPERPQPQRTAQPQRPQPEPRPQQQPQRPPRNQGPAKPQRKPQQRQRRQQPAPAEPPTLSQQVIGDDIPDLLQMPGITVVRGEQRDHVGAAAKHHPQ